MNGTEIAKELYCGQAFDSFHKAYTPTHGYVSFIVCIFGIIANVLNIIVLTRKDMITPTNAILTGLAVADLMVMVEYIPYSWQYYLPTSASKGERYTYGWAIFVLAHSFFTQVFHTISIWLTVTLAVWRLIAVAYPQMNIEWCGMQRTKIAIACGYLVSPLVNIPIFLSFAIQEKTILDKAGTNVTVFLVNVSELGLANGSLLVNVNFWIYSVIIKIIPCIALTVLSGGLVRALIDTKKRREALISGKRRTSRDAENERQTDRTTKMLLAVLLLFLITELPQGILGLLSGIIGRPFFEDCYSKLGEMMDILALLNSAINFMIYCSMSRQFRTTFSLLFRPRWLPVPQVDTGITHNNHTTMVTQL